MFDFELQHELPDKVVIKTDKFTIRLTSSTISVISDVDVEISMNKSDPPDNIIQLFPKKDPST